jgi:LAGLIDADG-like domain
MTKQRAQGYLAAMIDGEGSVICNPPRRTVTIFNTDRGIIDKCIEACNTLGLTYKISLRKSSNRLHKPCYDMWLGGRENLSKLHKLVSLGSESKQQALNEIQDSWVFKPSPTKAELSRLLKAGLTHREIGERLGYASHYPVQYHLRRCGLL